jgi:hypothetical protein
MGKNPSGAISDIVEGLDQIKRAKPVVVTVIALQVLIWVGTWQDLYNGWWFTILTALNLLVVPRVVGLGMAARARRTHDLPAPVAPELVGIDRPFTDADLAEMDLVLGLDGVPLAREDRAHAPA